MNLKITIGRSSPSIFSARQTSPLAVLCASSNLHFHSSATFFLRHPFSSHLHSGRTLWNGDSRSAITLSIAVQNVLGNICSLLSKKTIRRCLSRASILSIILAVNFYLYQSDWHQSFSDSALCREFESTRVCLHLH